MARKNGLIQIQASIRASLPQLHCTSQVFQLAVHTIILFPNHLSSRSKGLFLSEVRRVDSSRISQLLRQIHLCTLREVARQAISRSHYIFLQENVNLKEQITKTKRSKNTLLISKFNMILNFLENRCYLSVKWRETLSII